MGFFSRAFAQARHLRDGGIRNARCGRLGISGLRAGGEQQGEGEGGMNAHAGYPQGSNADFDKAPRPLAHGEGHAGR